jgi:hypothetical protein
MSAIIFADGFDTYTTVLDKWDGIVPVGSFISAPVAIVPGVGRGGAGALQLFSATVANNNYGSGVIKNVGARTTTYVGFAFYFNPTGQTGDAEVARFMDGSLCQVSLWITAAGVFYFNRGDNTAALGPHASVSYPTNSYHYVEVGVSISGSVGVCQLKIDQTSILNITGVNTQATGNSTFTAIHVGSMNFTSSNLVTFVGYLDDVYFDTSGFNGDVRVNGQVPSGNGSTQNFSNVEASWVLSTITRLQTTIVDSNGNLQRATAITGDFKTGAVAPTWATVAGNPTTDNHVTWTNLGAVSQWKLVSESDPDGDSSYISSNTLNDISRFTYPAVTGSSVLAVIVWVFGRKDDGGLRTIQASIKSGGTVGTSGTDVALGTNYQSNMLQSLTDPNTGAAWTLAAVNAAEFGIKITN